MSNSYSAFFWKLLAWMGIVINTLFIFLFSACSFDEVEYTEEAYQEKTTSTIAKIDSILGDKMLDGEKKLVRENNFDQLLNFQREDFNQESKLYTIVELTNSIFHVSQVKTYNEARNFELFIKMENDTVSDYLVIHDEKILDMIVRSDTIFVLTQFIEVHREWKKNNGIAIYALGKDLTVYWKKDFYGEYKLGAVKFDSNHPENLAFYVELYEASQMVFNEYKVTFNEFGDVINYTHFRSMNTKRRPSDETLRHILNLHESN